MPAYSIDGVIPVVHPDAYVHPTAVLIGDVHVGAGCYVGPLASLRGDFGRIVMLEGSNLQDSCVFHTFPGTEAVLGREGHVGHGAVLHGCRVGAGALVGMNAVVMDGAEIGAEAFVGAHAFVKAGFVVPPRTLAAGSPARIVRGLTPQELAWKANGTRVYRELAARSRASLREVVPLPAPEPGRPALPTGAETAVPLDVARSAAPPGAEVALDVARPPGAGVPFDVAQAALREVVPLPAPGTGVPLDVAPSAGPPGAEVALDADDASSKPNKRLVE